MKKNTMLRIASVLLVAVLLSTCGISGTFAKYASTFEGSSTAKVAKWAVTVEGETEEKAFTFDIFETVKDSDGVSEETHVTDEFVAPGMTGSFTIEINNASDVTALYKATISETSDSPIVFTIDNPTAEIGIGKTATVTINWSWPIGDTSGTDNKYAGTSFTVTVNVEVEQVD